MYTCIYIYIYKDTGVPAACAAVLLHKLTNSAAPDGWVRHDVRCISVRVRSSACVRIACVRDTPSECVLSVLLARARARVCPSVRFSIYLATFLGLCRCICVTGIRRL